MEHGVPEIALGSPRRVPALASPSTGRTGGAVTKLVLAGTTTAPGTVQPGQSGDRVETTLVAPTILKLLGLSPSSLQAVQREGTQVLPGLGNGE